MQLVVTGKMQRGIYLKLLNLQLELENCTQQLMNLHNQLQKSWFQLQSIRKLPRTFSLIPLSNDTVKKRIDDLLTNIKEQLLERICMFPPILLCDWTKAQTKWPYCAILNMSMKTIFSKTYYSPHPWCTL